MFVFCFFPPSSPRSVAIREEEEEAACDRSVRQFLRESRPSERDPNCRGDNSTQTHIYTRTHIHTHTHEIFKTTESIKYKRGVYAKRTCREAVRLAACACGGKGSIYIYIYKLRMKGENYYERFALRIRATKPKRTFLSFFYPSVYKYHLLAHY